MIYEVAIDPQAGADWCQLCRLLGSCGFATGKLVARLPKRWEDEATKAYDKSPSYTDIGRAKVVEYLECAKRRRKFWPDEHGRGFDYNKSWLRNAVEQHATRPFHAIVSDADAPRANMVLRTDEACEQSARWDVPHHRNPIRTPGRLAECLAPVLEVARHIKFVDYLFDPSTARYTKPLIELVRRIAAKGTDLVLEYHLEAKDKYPAGDFQEDCREWIATKVPQNAALLFVRWPKSKGLHKRMVLCELGGVSVDPGLSLATEEAERETMTVSLLPESEYNEVWTSLASDGSAGRPVDMTWVTAAVVEPRVV